MTLAFIGVLSAVAGAVGGGLITFLTTRWQIRAQLELDYDRNLREQRLTAYRDLWGRLEPLALYQRPRLSGAEAKHLSSHLTQWYYQAGGIFLSVRAREDYFGLQNALNLPAVVQTKEDDLLDPPAYERLRVAASALRTALVADIGTRAAPLPVRGVAGRDGPIPSAVDPR